MKKMLIAIISSHFFLAMLGTLFLLFISMHDVSLYKSPKFTALSNVNFNVDDSISIYIDNKKIIVPKGFVAHIKSLPTKLFTFIVEGQTSHVLPAIIQDYLYECPDIYTRKQVDDIFYSLLLNSGISTTTAAEYYVAVRIFGSSHFKAGRICKK